MDWVVTGYIAVVPLDYRLPHTHTGFTTALLVTFVHLHPGYPLYTHTRWLVGCCPTRLHTVWVGWVGYVPLPVTGWLDYTTVVPWITGSHTRLGLHTFVVTHTPLHMHTLQLHYMVTHLWIGLHTHTHTHTHIHSWLYTQLPLVYATWIYVPSSSLYGWLDPFIYAVTYTVGIGFPLVVFLDSCSWIPSHVPGSLRWIALHLRWIWTRCSCYMDGFVTLDGHTFPTRSVLPLFGLPRLYVTVGLVGPYTLPRLVGYVARLPCWIAVVCRLRGCTFAGCLWLRIVPWIPFGLDTHYTTLCPLPLGWDHGLHTLDYSCPFYPHHTLQVTHTCPLHTLVTPTHHTHGYTHTLRLDVWVAFHLVALGDCC